MPDENYLRAARIHGRDKELAEKLLPPDHENKALGVAQATLTASRDVTWFAEQLLKSGEAWREAALEVQSEENMSRKSKQSKHKKKFTASAAQIPANRSAREGRAERAF